MDWRFPWPENRQFWRKRAAPRGIQHSHWCWINLGRASPSSPSPSRPSRRYPLPNLLLRSRLGFLRYTWSVQGAAKHRRKNSSANRFGTLCRVIDIWRNTHSWSVLPRNTNLLLHLPPVHGEWWGERDVAHCISCPSHFKPHGAQLELSHCLCPRNYWRNYLPPWK